MKTKLLIIPMAVSLALATIEASYAGEVIEGAVSAKASETAPAVKTAGYKDIVLPAKCHACHFTPAAPAPNAGHVSVRG